jgi:hypothetical protein
MSTFLKKELEDANFVVEEIMDNVLLVKDYMLEEELKEIFSIKLTILYKNHFYLIKF